MQVASSPIKNFLQGPTENKLLQACCRYYEKNELILPTIPEVAFKIRRAVNEENTNSTKIARLVQVDPSITARLIRLSNSPVYRGRKTIESCPEAITRIGLKAVQDIVTAFSLKAVFTPKSPFIRHRMIELWEHSRIVASISAVLARKAKGFDPDRAMLAGLIHDIGKVPILIFVDHHIDLAINTDHIDETIDRMHGLLGLNIIQQWNFPEDFDDVVIHSEDWHRDTRAPLDYADIVMLAQLHSLIGKADIKTLPKIDTLPAYQKIARHLDASGSVSILDTAREEIEMIQQMLG